MTFSPENNLISCCEDNGRKFFTVTEANRSLVLVTRIAEDVVREHNYLLDLQETIDAAQVGDDDFSAESARRKTLEIVDRLRACLDEIECIGAELQDWSLGRVDFPCMVNGREVRLCWQRGEKRVMHWHDVSIGCEDRQDIETLNACEVQKV